MDWQITVALVIAVPVILLPVAFVWYLNGAGMYRAFQAAMERRRAAREKTTETASKVEVR
ncbi:MAG: hypothetical protein A2147_05835 [Chloroflexi bacterium RBG_16_57_8]|nr:MAG: hypothetical protein A2147_05835 [Chloroflexi bacterium RBG_16_57_8]